MALTLPMLVRHHFDPSVFIVAGDRFVTAGNTPSPIVVRPHSDGYDGQFYYRLALTPLLGQQEAAGVRLDHPAWRMQRILLPLLARLLARGDPGRVPAALFAVNIIGLFALAWLAMALARRLDFSPSVPLAIVMWPGLLIALTHDTTEILAASLLLAAVSALLAERVAIYAPGMALATLARETPMLAAAGFFAMGLKEFLQRASRRGLRAPLLLGAALLPFLLWQQIVATIWHDAPQAHGIAHNAGWPLAGWVQALLANLLNRPIGAAVTPHGLAVRATMLAGLGGLAAFCVWIVPLAWRHLRRDGTTGLAAAWLLTMCLMAVLTANGPLIDSTALFRAFTECWVLGWVLAGLARVPMPRWIFCVIAPLLLRSWSLCYLQLT